MTRRPVSVFWGEAAAKVNLALAITGRREDGYHLLRSVFMRLTLHDHLEVRPAAQAAGRDELLVEGDPGLPLVDNLVLRAALSLREASARPLPALRFRLSKHIPSAAGLAGGSSDAATALALASEAWGIPADRAALLALAARLGADVPFFASGHPAALVSGIGTSMEELPAPLTAAGVLLVTPADRLSTAAVFAEFDRPGPIRGPSSETGAAAAADELAEALRAGLDGAGLAAWAGRLRGANDLWAAASRLSPGLAAARDGLEQALGRPFLLTGSGTTLFAVYPSAEAAANAARQLERARPGSLRDATIDASATSSREGSP